MKNRRMIYSKAFIEAVEILKTEPWSPEVKYKMEVLEKHIRLEERSEFLLLLDRYSHDLELSN